MDIRKKLKAGGLCEFFPEGKKANTPRRGREKFPSGNLFVVNSFRGHKIVIPAKAGI
jgi:hypothetical protein